MALFILVMFTIAARTAGTRITGNRTWAWAAAPIAAGVVPVAGLLLESGAVPVTGLVLIPLVGQLIGGALTAAALTGRCLLDELARRAGKVEVGLALVLDERAARMEVARPRRR